MKTLFAYTEPDRKYPGYVNISMQDQGVAVTVREDTNYDAPAPGYNVVKIIPASELKNMSDGYHTFDELYQHRCVLFACLMKSHPDLSWKSKKHSDGSEWEGWFIAGMRLPTGDVTYHLPADMWELLGGIDTLELGVAWDGHTSADVVARLTEFAKW